ncbi:MAG: hypothetical protein JNJ54_30935 [Myxococcaceae bacterium]|nr:hypothetical protein [Myxococcaceae bacterium]
MRSPRRRTWPWLVVAALLLLVGGWVMLGAEPPPRPPPPPIDLPTRMTPAERARVEARRTFLPAQPADGVQAPPPRPMDPLLSLAPSSIERGAVVAEVSAILNSELGGLLFECVTAGAPRLLSDLRDAGFDPMVHVDRMAVFDDTLAMTGSLQKLPMPPGSVVKQYGRRAKLVELPGGNADDVLGVWDDQLLVAAKDEASTKALLDRLERGEAPRASPLTDSLAFGEVYGVINPQALGDLFGEDDRQVRDALVSATKGLQLHVDVGHDVGVVADVEANDAARTDELRRTIGSVVSLARLRAQSRGRSREAELLDLARVRGGSGGGFRVEAGVPHEMMKTMLAQCVQRQQERLARRASAADAGSAAP